MLYDWEPSCARGLGQCGLVPAGFRRVDLALFCFLRPIVSARSYLLRHIGRT